jgi:hypothetical protein
MMEWMKFIVLDTRREGRLKLNRRSHIGLIAEWIVVPQGASASGGLSLFSARRFDHSTECERFVRWFFR